MLYNFKKFKYYLNKNLVIKIIIIIIDILKILKNLKNLFL